MTYVERTGQVHYLDPQGPSKTWLHAVDFLADSNRVSPRLCRGRLPSVNRSKFYRRELSIE